MSMQGVQQRRALPPARRDGGAGFATQLSCFLLGGAVGAVAALLFAPKSGRELRGDIADAARQGVDSARERASGYYEATRGRATELYSTASQRAGEVAQTARQSVARRGETLSAAIEAGKRAYHDEKRRTERSALAAERPTYEPEA